MINNLYHCYLRVQWSPSKVHVRGIAVVAKHAWPQPRPLVDCIVTLYAVRMLGCILSGFLPVTGVHVCLRLVDKASPSGGGGRYSEQMKIWGFAENMGHKFSHLYVNDPIFFYFDISMGCIFSDFLHFGIGIVC